MLDLWNNQIQTKGAEYLADALKYNHVRQIIYDLSVVRSVLHVFHIHRFLDIERTFVVEELYWI